MSRFLKQSTAATAVIGPAMNLSGIGYLSAQSATVNLSKGNASFAVRNSTASASAHDTQGWYRFPLDSTDTNTVGPFVIIMVDSSTQLPVWHEYTVLPANVYDSLVGGTDTLSASVGKWLGTTPNSLISGRVDANAQVVGSNAIAIGSIAASALSAAAFSNNTITSGILAASAVGGSQLAQNCIGAVQLSAGAIDIGKFAASALSAAAFSNSTIVASVIDKTGYTLTTNSIPVGAFAASAIAASAFGANAIDSTVVANNAIGIGKIAASALSAAAFSSNTIVANVIGASAFTSAKFALDAIDDNAFASAARTKIWNQVMAEPSSVVAVNDTAIKGVSWLTALTRNKSTQTSAAFVLRNDADNATIASAAVTDSGGTFTRAEMA